jgi:hypothetical protein
MDADERIKPSLGFHRTPAGRRNTQQITKVEMFLNLDCLL